MNKLSDKLHFNTKAHKYSLGKGKSKIIFTSCTSWIKQFFAPFDEEGASWGASKKAAKNGITKSPKEFKKEWKATRDFGTLVHKEVQEFINGERDLTHDNTIQSVQAYNCFEALARKYPDAAVHPEQMVYSKELKLAGTIDLLLVNPDNTVVLVDWKTNREIKREAYMNRTGKGPCSDMPDSNYYHYVLQLCTYGYILEKEYGFKVDKLILVHVTEAGYVQHKIDFNPSKVEEMTKWEL